MVTSMIPSVNNVFKNPNIIDMRFLSANIPYNPLINYDWSTTTTSGLRYLKDVGSTPTYNASMYFGRGAYLNGVDQTITVPINTTIQTSLKRVNGVVTINETLQTLTNYVISGLGVHKDYYLFTRLLTTAEKDSYTNTPELFYVMAQADSTCILNMPMCETSSTVRNYKTGIDYPITNYTSSVRDNAKNLQYGLQTCKFVRDSLGVIQSASDYLECDSVGYGNTGWIPSSSEDWSIETIIHKHSDGEYRLIGINNSNGESIGLGYFVNGNALIALDSYKILTTTLDINLFCVTKTLDEVKFYLNGMLVGSYLNTYKASSRSFYISGRNGEVGRKLNKPLRLFKVHNKVLTQEEITENYNRYVAKGLLV